MKGSKVAYGFLLSYLVTLSYLGYAEPDLSYILLASAWAGFVGGVMLLFLIWRMEKVLPLFLLAAIIGFSIALISQQTTVHEVSPLDREVYAQEAPMTLFGQVSGYADVRPAFTNVVIEARLASENSAEYPIQGKVLVKVYGGIWPPLQRGEMVQVQGKVSKPERIEDFNYPKYLELSGIRSIIHRGSIKRASELYQEHLPFSTRVLRMFDNARTATEDQIGLVLPEPHASLLAGLLTGSRRGLPKDVTENFRRGGITHIIAVSGFNVTIVLTLLGGCLFWIPVRRRVIPLSIGAILFCLFVGGGAPVVRATIMGILGLIALANERITNIRLSILWTVFFMTVLSPLTLWYDPSFQLSFLAVIGLAELSGPLRRLLHWVPETLAIRESLVATLAAQIATLPLIITLFDQFSIVAPLTNVLVAPLIPVAMLLGTASLLLSILWMPLGLLSGYYAWAVLELMLWIGNTFGSLSFAVFSF